MRIAMWKDNDQGYADSVVQLMLNQYQQLPKTGKPTDQEWTVAAAIVEESGAILRVVALGTGSKCVGRSALSPRGVVLHDAHAEVVARRSFLLYLMNEIQAWHETGASRIFGAVEDDRLVLREDIRFCFVSTAVPCGDAAIMPMSEAPDDDQELLSTANVSAAKRPAPLNVAAAKRPRMTSDVHRTGAKCLPAAVTQDRKEAGAGYHVTGQVRTKPGRGDPTASVSCSDKLARWNAVGLQGAQLSLLIAQPLHFSCVVIAGGTPYSEESLERAINVRIGCPGKTHFLQSQISFPAGRAAGRARPAPCSIAWNVPAQAGKLGQLCRAQQESNRVQVCVEGRRLGATKAKSNQTHLNISKAGLHKRFLQVFASLTVVPKTMLGMDLNKVTYRELKDLAHNYQKNWLSVKNEHFKIWTEKPSGLESFPAES